MECSSVDLPDPFSPVSMISGWERSTIIGMWKFRFTKTGWARIFRYIARISISSWLSAQSASIGSGVLAWRWPLRLRVSLSKDLIQIVVTLFAGEPSFNEKNLECLNVGGHIGNVILNFVRIRSGIFRNPPR